MAGISIYLYLQDLNSGIKWIAGLSAEPVALLRPYHRLSPACPMENLPGFPVYISGKTTVAPFTNEGPGYAGIFEPRKRFAATVEMKPWKF
jgi:hypothetical protein